MIRGLAGLVLLVSTPVLHANDAAGLDLTIEVIGREDNIDERIVNRIEVPGVDLNSPRIEKLVPLEPIGSTLDGVVVGVGGVVEGVVEGLAPLVPLLRYDEWVERRREVEQDRQREARERARDRRD